MQLVHFGHSCILVEANATSLLFDPGTFATGFEMVRDLDAIVITHEHSDHLDLQRLPALVAANPNVQIFAPADGAAQISALGLSVQPTHAGKVLAVADTTVHVVGGNHAVIHPEVTVPTNLGYVVNDGRFYHPGDSFFRPQQQVDVLALPAGGPWFKMSDAIDFLRMVNPRIAVPIHQAVLAKPEMYYKWITTLAPAGTEVQILNHGESVEL